MRRLLPILIGFALAVLAPAQALLGLNAPVAPYDNSATNLAVQKQIGAVAAKIGAGVYRCSIPNTTVNVPRMQAWGQAAAASKVRVIAQFTSAAPSRDWMLAYPTSAWSSYNWNDYHCARMPVQAAVASYTVQCLNTKVLFDALIAAGGSPQQLVVCLENEPAPAKLVGGIWQSDWTPGAQYDSGYWDNVRAVAPLVRQLLPSSIAIATPAFSSGACDSYAKQYLAVAGQYVSKVFVNFYPGGGGYPALGSGSFIDGYSSAMLAMRYRLLDVTGLPISVMETAPTNAVDDADYVAKANQIFSWVKTSPFEMVCWFKPVAGGMSVSPSNLDTYGLIYPDGTVSAAFSSLAAQ